MYCYMLYCVAYFIIFVHYIANAILHVHTGTHVVIEHLYPTMCYIVASFMLVDLNIWCVYVESLLNICIFLHICFVVFIHIYIYPLLT